METDKKLKQQSNLIIFLCWAAYTAAYIGRLNFNAYIEPIRSQLGATKTELGLVSSFFFFSYGAGQLIHGILSKKYNTRYSVAAALIGSAAVNVGMIFCRDASAMKYVWFLNGVFQSILWSSVIKTLSSRLPDEMLSKAIVMMSTPPAIGTFLTYGTGAAMSAFGVNYIYIFMIPAIILAVVGVIWFIAVGSIKIEYRADKTSPLSENGKKKNAFTPVFVFGIIALTVAAVANGFIKDGVTTWTPSILKEIYGMKESFSILVTVLLPLIAIFGAGFSAFLHKKQKNTFALNGMLYLAETVVLLIVLINAKAVSGRSSVLNSPVILLVLFGISAMLMSAVNNIITSIIPMYMRDSFNSGLLAGVLDTLCYVGSTLSTALLGYIADRNSWTGVFFCLLCFGAAAFAVCAVYVAVTKLKKSEQ